MGKLKLLLVLIDKINTELSKITKNKRNPKGTNTFTLTSFYRRLPFKRDSIPTFKMVF